MATTMLAAELPFLDSFDHYANYTEMSRKWTQTGTSVVLGTGRDGVGQCIGSPGFYNAFKTFENEYATLSLGVAVLQNTYGGDILSMSNLRYGGASPGSANFAITNIGDGRIGVRWNGGSTQIIKNLVLTLGIWYYFELKVALSLVSGHIRATWNFSINENPADSGFTDTPGTYGDANGFASIFLGGLNTALGAQNFDDLYVYTGELLGDVRIAVLYPNAIGGSTVWTPNAAGDNYAKVNEHAPDDLTTYVYSSTPGDADDYNMDDISGPIGTIKAAQALWCAEKSDAGPASFQGQVIDGIGGGIDQTKIFYPSDLGWRYFHEGYRKSPFTGNDFTTSEINAIRLGQTRIV